MFNFLKLKFEPTDEKISEFESMLNNFYALQFSYTETLSMIYGIKSSSEALMFYIGIPEYLKNVIQKKFMVIDSYIEFEEIEDPLLVMRNKMFDNNMYIKGSNMRLMFKDNNKKLGIKNTDKKFYTNLISAMEVNNREECVLEIKITPHGFKQKINHGGIISKGVLTLGNYTIKGLAFLLDSTLNTNLCEMCNTKNNNKVNIISKNDTKEKDDEQDDIEINTIFDTNIKLISLSNDKLLNEDIIKSMGSAFADMSDSNTLIPINISYDEIFNRESKKHNNLLNASVISKIMHFPDRNIDCGNLAITSYKKLYDKDVPKEGIVFGDFDGIPLAFPGVPLSTKTYTKIYKKLHSMVDNLCKPKLVLGQQGTGKSEWLINYVISLVKLGIGAIVVDPKNDTQQRLIESLPDELLSRVEYINLGDVEYPPAFNLFKKRKQNDPTENSLIVTSFISLMKKESKNWGFKMQRTCQMTAEAILLLDKCTLNEFMLMLTEKTYRDYMIEYMQYLLTQSDVKGKSNIKKILKYWEEQNTIKPEAFWKEVEPVMNIIGPFMGNRIVSSIVSQYDSFDFRKAADEGKIVIVNIPEGTLRDNTRLLSSMINKAIWLDLQSRADSDISERYPVAWIIDEAHEIVDDEFIGVLTKARAYRLGLTLVTQGLSNFRMRGMENIKDLITTNCKNKITFRVGTQDSREMYEEFDPLTFNDLNNCPDYHFYGKILLQGKVSETFFGHAPACAPSVRNYDDFCSHHRSGKHTIDEIEDLIDERFEGIKLQFALRQC